MKQMNWLNNAKNTPSGKFMIIVVSCGQIPWLSLPAVSVQIHVVECSEIVKNRQKFS